MAEITFISNKTKKETYKYFFVIVSAVITWILQVSILSYFLFFDASPNLILLGSIYFGFKYGPLFGAVFGITASFFCSSNLYDHIFYFSYPIVGLFSGLLRKSVFSDELLFFMLLSFVLTPIIELSNGWQYSLNNSINTLERLSLISFTCAILNLIFSPPYYLLIRYITKKLNLL